MTAEQSRREIADAATDPDERRLVLAGAHNLRYVAGSTREGTRIGEMLLWRSNALHALDDDARRALRELQIRTVIDLREEEQRAERPDALDGVGAEVVALPLFDGTLPAVEELGVEACREGDLTPIFQHMVVACGPRIVTVIERLARPGALPAIVHCSGGKDRTGVVVALLLAALGVSEEDIVLDFVLTERYHSEAFFVDVAKTSEVRSLGLGPRARGADPEWIKAVLRHAEREHGDVATYLVDHGLDPAALVALRGTLLVDEPEVLLTDG